MEVYTRMLATYRTSYVSKTQVYKWVQKFTNRVQIIEDSSQPAEAHHIINHEITEVVDDLTQENHFITISEIAVEMKLLSVLHTPLLQKELDCRKICAWWITMKVIQKVRAGWPKKKYQVL